MTRDTVVSRTEIQIDGVGRIAVQPGGADIPALTAQRDDISGELSTLLQRLAVSNLAEAEERARQATQRQQDAKASQKVLEALAPKGVDALEAELAFRTVRGEGLRAALAGHLGEPAWKMLLKRLEESPEFRENWERYEVVGHRSKTKEFGNPQVGLLTLEHTGLWLAPELGGRMVTYTPKNEETRERLERLHRLAQGS